MTTTRFDPDSTPGTTTLRCKTCAITFADWDTAKEHMDTTLKAAPYNEHGNRSGHAISGTPHRDRQANVKRYIEQAIEDHLQDLFEELADLIEDDDITPSELIPALPSDLDLKTEWAAYTESNA